MTAGWRRLLVLLFFVVVVLLLATQARRIDWSEVLRVLAAYPHSTLLAGAALAAASHAVYSSYDLLGRAWTGHRLAAWRVVAITFVSYAFNLNFGALVGGVAFRVRLYSRVGLDAPTITKVLGLSLATNWLGYLVLAGALFAARVMTLPAGWRVGAVALQALGIVLLVAAAGYLALCAWSRRREWVLRGHTVTLPPARLALLQLLLSCINWLLIAGVLDTMLGPRVGYPLALGALLIAALAGVVAHVPAGLGVLEAVFIALLGTRMPQGELLAAVLGYRAIYYLLPLLLACAVFAVLEVKSSRHPGESRDPLVQRAPQAGRDTGL